MTNITQQEIIEIAVKSGLCRNTIAGIRINHSFVNGDLYNFTQLIEARLAARSDDRQSEPVALKALNEIRGIVLAASAPDDTKLSQIAKIVSNRELWALKPANSDDMAIYSKIAGNLAAPQQAIPAIDVNKMVDRFLGWKLPAKFSPDCGIGFNKLPHLHDTHFWPTGTNLFTADQAKAMFQHVLAGSHVELSAATTAPIDNVREALEKVVTIVESAQTITKTTEKILVQKIRALIPSTQAPNNVTGIKDK